MADPAAPATSTTPLDGHAGDAALYCPSCMYDLRGLSGDACPECGFELGEDSAARSSIPWSYRKVFNQPLLLLTTAWRTLRHPRRFCMALARPVERRDALAFRRMVVAVVWLVVAVCWSLAVWHDASLYLELDFWEDEVAWLSDYEEHLEALADLGPNLVWFNVGFGVLFGVWLYLVTGVQTYFAHRRGPSDELDQRAASLAYYACAPILLMVVPALVMLASGYMFEFAEESEYTAQGNFFLAAADAMFMASWLLVLLVAGLCLWSGVRFAGVLSGGGLGRQLIIAALLPLCWLGLSVLVFGVIPGILLLIYFVFATV